jgi:UDP-2-acetamido-3-amino-2,3-dideoxy-glucuronate N-acetyltransferase
MSSAFFCHPDARCESSNVGQGTRIWAFAHVLPGATIGDNCNICDYVFIENRVRVGNRVTVKCGVQLWDGLTVEDGAFIGPNATFSNDRYPPNRGRSEPFVPSETRIGANASIGANATILPGLTIGTHSLVAAGSVVTRSVPDYALVAGNPARVVRYLDERVRSDVAPVSPDWTLIPHQYVTPTGAIDARIAEGLPFRVTSFRLHAGAPAATLALEPHPHRFVLLVQGACSVYERGTSRQIRMDDPHIGVHLAHTEHVLLELGEDGSKVMVLSS